jgi:esterase/lipase superfamily enzyme
VDAAFEPRFRDAGLWRRRRSPISAFSDLFRPLRPEQGFRVIDAAAPYINAGRVTIYCPDSIDEESWYNKSIHPADRVKTHMAYENVILHDVFDFARRETSRPRVAVAGASFGGWQAVNLGFRHPDAVSHVISMSAAFEMTSFVDGYYDENFYYNNPPDYMAHCTDPWKYNHMSIILGTGEWDHCRGDNFRLSGILDSKGIKHFLDDRKWSGHEWSDWKNSFPYYLSLL